MPLAAVVLAAGKGTRMKSALPKVLHPVAGLPMVHHVLGVAREAGAGKAVVVLAKGMDDVAAAVRPAEVAIQDPPLGTGHAVMAARAQLKDFTGRVAVLFADTPLITSANVAAVEAAMDGGAAIGVLGFRPADAAMYGRLIQNSDGTLERIVEFKDATPEERRLRRWVVLVPLGILIVTLSVILLAALHMVRKSVLAGLPLMYLGMFFVAFKATRLAAAHYAGMKFIRSIDYRICPKCEYDLRGISISPAPGSAGITCPECGRHATPEELKERWEQVYRRLAMMKPGA